MVRDDNVKSVQSFETKQLAYGTYTLAKLKETKVQYFYITLGLSLKKEKNILRRILISFRMFMITYANYYILYKNQINARALIGQSAVGYCAGKPTEKSRVFRIII